MKNISCLFKHTIFTILLLAGFIAVTSCGNLFFDNIKGSASGSGETVTFTGSINIGLSDGGALPAEYANLVRSVFSEETSSNRAALPDTTNATTTVEASASGESTITQNVTGNSFTINLKSGKLWTVSVVINNDDGDPILSDSTTFDFTTTTPVASYDFVLVPDTTGQGEISLTFNGGTGKDAGFDSVEVKSVAKSGLSSSEALAAWNSAVNVSTTGISMKTNSKLDSGTYDVLFHFKKNDQLVFYTPQQILVLSNMITTQWVSSGSSSTIDPISGDTFEVTAELIQNQAIPTEIYVGSAGTGITASDTTGTGSLYKPYETLAHAVSVVNDLTKRTAAQNPYVIRVKDGVTENIAQSITIQNNISIECWKNSPNDKAGTATLEKTANNIDTFEVDDGGSLTIDGASAGNDTWSGLVIDGKEKTGGSGIYVNEGGTLTLNGGTIKNCKNYSGGGVYTSGTFTMNGGVIMTNESTNSTFSGGSEGGGGVLLYKGTFTMNDGVISQNTAALGGGGVLVYENTSFVMGDSVGNGTPKITNNTAAEGGGVFAYCNGFTMNRGSISNNISTTTNAREGGGGVFIDGRNSSAQFTMNGGKIEGNQTASNGGGVGFDKSSSDSNIQFIMTGGIINNNKAENGKGGGVYLERSNMCMYGTAVIGDSTDRDSAATSISHSNIAKAGGGIASVQGNVYIGYSDANTPAPTSTGGIYYNYATGTGASEGGGGIYKATKIAYSNIKYNGTAGKGGGIYAESDVMFSDGVVVSGNAATGNGSGVYSRGVKLGLQGTAYVQASGTGENDVYLDVYSSGPYTGYGSIEISGALNPPAAAGGKVAKITPNYYTRTDVIVNVAEDSGYSSVSEVKNKFTVTPNNENNYRVKSDGKIEVIQTVDVNSGDGLVTALSEGNSSIAVSSDLTLGSALDLSPSESDEVVIDGGNEKADINGDGEFRISVSTGGDITFTNIDFTNGKITDYGEGGGMLKLVGNSENSLTISNCSFTNCSTPDRDTDGNHGGSIYIIGFKTITIENTTFYANNGNGNNGTHPATSGGFIYIDTESVEDATISING